MTRILIVDDQESICWGLQQLCQDLGYESEIASSAERGLELARQQAFDAIIMDVRLPGMDGLTAIPEFHAILGAVPVITITAFGDLPTAIGAVRQGAFEYLLKPFDIAQVQTTLRQAIATRRLRQATSSQAPTSPPDAHQLIGQSPLIQEVYKLIALATTTDAPVLITGESGTGKELTARSIHQFGPRAAQPFVAINIASLSAALVESELFGHVAGAFTGADSSRQGVIQQAHGGTLFLDEVAEIPMEIQVKLLRVLDQGEVTPVGCSTPIPVDFRLVSATHQDLLAQVNHGEFRHDLLYRLRTLEIQLPPLRDRPEDIPALVEHFLNQIPGNTAVATPEFLAALAGHAWPGNIRQLQSVVERSATLARGGLLTADLVATSEIARARPPQQDLQDRLREDVVEWISRRWQQPGDRIHEQLIELVESAMLPRAFELSDQQYSAAARRLGIHRTTLKKKLDELLDGKI